MGGPSGPKPSVPTPANPTATSPPSLRATLAVPNRVPSHQGPA
ncbi:hypothetical protein [Lysobacter gummosus]